ncbi:hypothetical protein [Sandarakinorhabdus sp.]|uniref:hypothetical protein n=1 Tax=Sandarakinorhabdus sp. TaxID=1916663 RepID=UPI003341B477
MVKTLLIFAFALMLLSIGLLIYGIKTDKSLVTVAMPLLVVGISLLTVANAQNAKNKKK